MTTASSVQILFIDAAVTDEAVLLASVDPSIEVIRLSADEDGLIQIARALAGRSDVDSVHVVSHGEPGVLVLGSSRVDAAALADHPVEMATIRAALSDAADLLLYGCDVAAGSAGESFLAALAGATGADVAASVDATGAGRLGGDWALEAATGPIEATAMAAPQYDALLPTGTNGGVFDNGFIKFGYSTDGTFGYGSRTTPGIFYDSTGSGTYAANADFLTPGSPFEFFSVKVGSTTYVNNNASYTAPQMATTVVAAAVVVGGKTYGSLTFTSLAGGLEVVQTYTLGASSEIISIAVSVRNATAGTIYGAKYARGIDPDVDSPLGTTSTQNVRGATGIAAGDIVLGTGPISHKVIGLYTNSTLVHNTSVSPGWSTDPAALLGTSANNTADSTINLAFDLGDLAAGQVKSFSFAYVFAASAADLQESIDEVPASNPAPTLTAFSAPVDTVVEDTVVEVTFAELVAQGNEADLNASGSTGTVSAFVVKAIGSGTLAIGTSVGTATAWAPSSNDVIDATHQAFWTPAANANGTLGAFTVVARDSEGAVSATPVAVQVAVATVNDAPTLASDAALASIAEDAVVTYGSSVQDLFAPRFADVDVGNTLGGIVVVGDASNAGQGTWQYSTDDGDTWFDIGGVSAANGLALAASALLHFAPAADFNGAPGSLTIHAADSAFAGGYSSGAAQAHFDTTTDAANSGVSAGSRTLTTTVTALNDAPVFTSAAVTQAITETAADDGSAFAVAAAFGGRLAAVDGDGPAGGMSFSIRGGTLAGGVWTKMGLYGTLELDAATLDWSYVPNKFSAVNALAAGQVAHDLFDFKVTDADGAAALQAMDVALTGSNDTPRLVATIADQVFSGSGSWTYQVPAGSITDAEGRGLAYTVEVLDGSGDVIDTIAAAQGVDPTKASSWLTFDEATRTFSGNPTTAWADAPVTLRVTATDGGTDSSSHTFSLTLTGTANQPPAVANPLGWTAVDSVRFSEVALSETLGGTRIVFDGQTLLLGQAANGTQVAAALSTAFGSAGGSAHYVAAVKSDADNVLVLTSKFAGAQNQFGDGTTVQVSGGSYRVSVSEEVITARAETAVVQFVANSQPYQGHIYFDGVSIDIDAGLSPDGVAAAVAAAVHANSGGVWDAVVDSVALDQVNFTSRATGPVRDLELWDFSTMGPDLATALTITQQGASVHPEIVELAFTGSYGGVPITLDGVTAVTGSVATAADVAAALTRVSATPTVTDFVNVYVGQQGGGQAWERTDMVFADQSWHAGATVTLTMPRYDAAGTAFTVTTAPLPDSPTGIEIVLALKAAVAALPDASPLSATGQWYITGVNVTPGPIGDYGDYGVFNLDNSGEALQIWATAGNVNTPDITASVLQAQVPVNYLVSDLGGGVVGVTDLLTGLPAVLTANAFGGTYAGTLTPSGTFASGAWTHAIPAGTFTDPDGDTLTYSAYSIDPATGAATLLVDSDALSFDEATATLAGDGLVPASMLIEIRALDAASGASAASQFQLVVYQGAQAVSLVAGVAPDAAAFAGPGRGSYTVPASAFDYEDGHTGGLTYSASAVDASGLPAAWPAWLAFDSATGTFSGNPPNGSSDLLVQVTATKFSDPGVSATTPTFTLPVSAPNDALVLVAPIADQALAAGQSFGLWVAPPFSDPDGNADGTASSTGITYSATANGQPLADFGLTMVVRSDGGLTFSGNPTAEGPYLTIVVTGVETTGGSSASTSFTLNLNDADAPGSSPMGLNANNAGTIEVTGTPTQGQTLTAAAPVDADGITGAVIYQWQVSRTGGSSWSDIAGSRGQGAALTLAESEAGLTVRVQAFYSDNGGVAEAPVSGTFSVVNVNDIGAVAISGALTPGQTLVAAISDGDGLVSAAPTYQWYRDGVAVPGATYSAYTLTNADGGKSMRVDVAYTDDHDGVETRQSSPTAAVQLGAIAPVAADDTGSATEASGVANATPGSEASGNLLANDTDVNVGDTRSVVSVRSGAVEGLGLPSAEMGGELVIEGQHGTLRVNPTTGAYTYEVAEGDGSVEALLGFDDTLTDSFNYTVADATALMDTAVLTITIHGANDAATLTGIAATTSVVEDVPTALPLGLTITDADASGGFALRLDVGAGTLRAASADSGVVVSGTDTGTLTITAGSSFALQGWLASNSVFYVTPPNSLGTIATLSYSIDDGSGFVALAGTTAITSNATNNPPVVDLDGDDSSGAAGNDFVATFRPRGAEVAVVGSDIAISDIDAGDVLLGATVTLTDGAFDNAFGTLYETLRSTAGDSLGGIAIAGNGTTQIVLTGAASYADYQEALKTIVYNNDNPNAFSGDRTITVSVTDAAGQASNAGSFATAVPNTSIAVGQRIFMGATDTGFTVGQVIDSQHFVASGPLAGLAPGVVLDFWAAGSLVTSATQAGPVVATTTILVPWTPVIDMSGDVVDGRDHVVTYIEGQSGVAIATSDASITDQDGNIASVTITLTNPLDGGLETLFIPAALATQLAALGLTISGNQSGTIVLGYDAVGHPGGLDATYFQIGLRSIQYVNTSQDPAPAGRIVTVTSTDVNGNTGVDAQTTINVLGVNDAPAGTDTTLTIAEDAAHVLTAADFGFADVEGDAFFAVVVTALPGAGQLSLDGVAVTAGQSVTVADIDAGRLAFTPAANLAGAGHASVGFRVQDGGGVARGGVDLDLVANTLTFDVTPVNDAPVLTAAAPVMAAIGENDIAGAGQSIGSLVGAGPGTTGIADADLLNGGGAGLAPETVGRGVAVTGLSGGGGTWQYSVDAGASWADVGTVDVGAALLLRSVDRMRFVPDAIDGSAASFGYVLWDGQSGAAGAKVDVAVRGGSTAFSLGGDTASLAIVEINDAPSGADRTLTVGEDTARVLTAADFGFSDVDGDALLSVTLVGLPGLAQLTLDGVAVSAGQRVLAVDIDAGKLVFRPAADASGLASTSFSFRVQDDGGIADGGVDTSAAARVITIDLTPVNDAPVATPAAPTLTAISENDIGNAGQLVSSLVGSGSGRTGVGDVDTLNNDGAGFAPEAVGQGIAIHQLASAGPADGGSWQYSLDAGASWAAMGAVSEGNALLLRGSDLVRFVPDALNGTTASLGYYVWDGAIGSAGARTDASVRGGSSAFSSASDTATIVVGAVNDAPMIDLNGSGSGTELTTTFRPRGDAVAVVAPGVSIVDADKFDASTPDTLVSATVTLATGALDNLFGTLYETLRSSAGSSIGGITIGGNGTTTLTFTGAGTHADYEAALRTVLYENTNPNAVSGNRTVEFTVRDASVSTGNSADQLSSAVATTTIEVPWTPVIDLNGGTTGRNTSVAFVERSAGVAIAAADASIVDQDGNIATVTVTLTNPLDGALETLFIAAPLVTQLAALGITVIGNQSHGITLTGNKDGSTFQLALRGIQYVNTSNHPDPAARTVSVESVDQQGHTGVGAVTTINLTTINDAPVGADGTVALVEDIPHAFTLADFPYSDLEEHAPLAVIVTALPASGSLTLDGVPVTTGQEIAAADIAAGRLVFSPVADSNDTQNGPLSLAFQLRDAGGTAAGGIDLDATPNTLVLNVAAVNDAPTGTLPATAPSVTVTGELRLGVPLTAHADIVDVDRTSSEIIAATAYQWQSRTVPAGAWSNIGGATAATLVLGAAQTNREVRVVVTYADDSGATPATVVFDSARADRPAIIANGAGDITLVIDTAMPVLIVDPIGDVSVVNAGTGTLTIVAPDDGVTLNVAGPGATTVTDPRGNLTVVNAGPGLFTIGGLLDGAFVGSSGAGPITIADPAGGIDLLNAGPGLVTITGLDDGNRVSVSGAGPTTVDGPDGDVRIDNAGPGLVTVGGLLAGAVVDTSGDGPTLVAAPAGDLAIGNAGPGTVTVSGLADGSVVTASGAGPVRIDDPLGSLSVVNDGTGGVTVTGVDAGRTVQLSGSGATTIADPDGAVTIDNAGPGLATVTGAMEGAILTLVGGGATVVAGPVGDLVLNNVGSGSARVDGLQDGATLTLHGTGPTQVSAPLGDLTLVNLGTGLVTTTGLMPGSTVTFVGSGPQAIDLAGFPTAAGIGIVLNNTTDAAVEVLNAPDDASVRSSGTGDVAIAAPTGDLHIHNDGTGLIGVVGLIDGAVVVKTGPGPALIDHPAGSFTAVNDDAGLLSVRHVGAGATLALQGSGPVAIESGLAAGEHVIVDTSLNSNVRLSNTGAGTIDVLGDLRLDEGDPVRINLSGAGATALTVTGGLTLDGTPLSLQLDAAYLPHLGDRVTLVDNDGADPVAGTFAGMPEGAPVVLGGVLFRISYVGGTGNDVVLTRVNDAPLGAVLIVGTAAQNQTLVATNTLTDTDGVGTVRYQWLIDGAVVALGASYTLAQAQVGKAITLVAEYTDAEGTLERVASAPTAPVANVNDAVTGQVLIAGEPTLGQTLVASHTLADIDGLGTVSYQWQADGSSIAGATGASHTLGAADVGKLISVMASFVDVQGTAEAVASAATAVVADGNGIAPAVEAQVPGIGVGAIPGDGNGDGFQDALQPNVVSAPLDRTDSATPTFVTLVVDSVGGKPAVGSTSSLVDFEQILAPTHLPAWASVPTGAIGFTALVDGPGATESFSLYVAAGSGVNGYWSMNADGVLVNLASAAYGGGMVLEGDKLRLDFKITEGGEFDSGPAGDSSITNVGAAGHASLSLIGYTIDAPVEGALNIWD